MRVYFGPEHAFTVIHDEYVFKGDFQSVLEQARAELSAKGYVDSRLPEDPNIYIFSAAKAPTVYISTLSNPDYKDLLPSIQGKDRAAWVHVFMERREPGWAGKVRAWFEDHGL